jgi:alanine-glyoxylate transaminase/(R)-3-amino-2-methylpropionate-pyruvate transaminase
MVTMAKGIGNGAPLSAVTTRPVIAANLARKLHFNTFGGNPVSVTAGLATLEVIEQEQIQQRALKLGGYLREKLLWLKDKHALIGDVRGMGLLQGVELVANRETKEPATDVTKRVVERVKGLGLLVGKSGGYWNTIRLAPPMCVREPDLDFLADCLDQALGDENVAGAG